MGLPARHADLRRRWITAMGRPWVFWPVLLFGGIQSRGPDRWGSTWTWLAILILVGPLLSLGIHSIHRRGGAQAPGTI